MIIHSKRRARYKNADKKIRFYYEMKIKKMMFYFYIRKICFWSTIFKQQTSGYCRVAIQRTYERKKYTKYEIESFKHTFSEIKNQIIHVFVGFMDTLKTANHSKIVYKYEFRTLICSKIFKKTTQATNIAEFNISFTHPLLQQQVK